MKEECHVCGSLRWQGKVKLENAQRIWLFCTIAVGGYGYEVAAVQSEVGRMLSTNREIVFRVPCSVSVSCVACRGRKKMPPVYGCVQDPCPAAAAPWYPRWCPVHLSSFIPCHALSSRTPGFGLHSPNLLGSHLAGLTGTIISPDTGNMNLEETCPDGVKTC